MNALVVLGVVLAVLLHTALLLFGGLLFGAAQEDRGRHAEVVLLDAQEPEKKDAPEETEPQAEELATQVEEAPDAAEILRSLEAPAPIDAPALDAASLSAIEQALNGQGGSGDFADGLNLASGGRIGGMGSPGASDQTVEDAFNLSEIDQKPRPILQVAPLYPAELRGKKLEGVVTVIFVVDPSGKVANPRVERSNHPAFERPTLDAVRQWRFEPALRAGQRVNCKMRIPIRFQAS